MSESQTPVVLLIRDGWGENHDSSQDACNAVKLAATPNADRLRQEWPRTEIRAGGRDVGLPGGIMGNSEVGHQNIGAGRIVDQEIVRIDKAVEEGRLTENETLRKAFANVKSKGGRLHIMGLVSDAGVHAMLTHLYGLLRAAGESGISEVFVHAFTDGRDTGPFTGIGFLRQVEAEMRKLGIGRIATVCGRYWSMDRDNRWDRVRRAYDCLTGRNVERTAASAEEALRRHYDEPESSGTQGDEFCPPTAVADESGTPFGRIADGDSVIFSNFRGDRPRELTRAFIETDFDAFDRGARPGIFFATMTEYQKGLCPNIVFSKPPKLEAILGDSVSRRGIAQFRCAETEKFPHVTFFFNDYREEPFAGEERTLVPSPQDCKTYDEKPEMSARGVCDAAAEAIRSGKYGLVVVNFANPDMVGHTGVLEATVRACEVVDGCVGELLEAVDEVGGRAVVTADHGNAEQMINPETGGAHTSHTLNPVEVIVYGKDCAHLELEETGRLGDIAPTLLALMKLPQPEPMTGRSLIRS